MVSSTIHSRPSFPFNNAASDNIVFSHVAAASHVTIIVCYVLSQSLDHAKSCIYFVSRDLCTVCSHKLNIVCH